MFYSSFEALLEQLKTRRKGQKLVYILPMVVLICSILAISVIFKKPENREIFWSWVLIPMKV